jgi:hypothetical protein
MWVFVLQAVDDNTNIWQIYIQISVGMDKYIGFYNNVGYRVNASGKKIQSSRTLVVRYVYR